LSVHAAAPRQPGVLAIYAPKWLSAQRRAAEGATLLRTVVFGVTGLAFWAVVFGMVLRLLLYFRRTPGIGEVLSIKLLGVILLALFAILLLSNIITSLSSFFLARDLELLAAAPVDGVRVYTARLIETAVHSSWMVLLMLVPILSAYAIAFRAGPLFFAVMPLSLLCYLLIPAVIGTAVTQVLVNVFPARRARDLLALVALLGTGAIVMLFRMIRPERLARPEGFRSLVDFIAALETPQSMWLPSEWTAEAIVAPLQPGGVLDLFPALLLATTAAAFFVIGAWLHGRLYAEGLSRSQEGADQRDTGTRRRPAIEPVLRGVPVTTRSLIAKDIRTFFRDTTQWSQLILLAVLVVVYIYNIRVLPLFSGEDVGFFMINVVSFLNLGLAGFVLAAIAARFLFPAISLEGRSLWLLRSSPLDLRALVWSKFCVGLVPLLLLALALTAGTNAMLRVSGFMMTLSLIMSVVMTTALAALALGFGALFPKFNTENAAEIPTGFGGLLYMMTSVAYLGVVIMLEAQPVYAILSAQVRGHAAGPEQWTALVIASLVVLGISLLATVLPLRTAVRRIESLD
jgi:ABC-2 type transport system permease protein